MFFRQDYKIIWMQQGIHHGGSITLFALSMRGEVMKIFAQLLVVILFLVMTTGCATRLSEKVCR